MRSKPNHPSNDLRNFRSFFYSSKEKKEKEKINRLSRDVYWREGKKKSGILSFAISSTSFFLKGSRFRADGNTL